MDIEKWLCGLGLQQYVTTFRDNAIDAEILPELNEADLEKLGVVLGHRKRLLKAIATIASPAGLERATPDGQAPSIGDSAERRQLTVMFCDLVGSTALASRFDPEDMREVIGAYHRCVAKTVARFDGFIAKYMGDGVLVYFGYPQAHEHDAERAVRAALKLLVKIAELRPHPSVRLQLRVGIATGLAVVGDLVGSGEAQERGIVGETPNLAARLQAFADPGAVVVDQSTRNLIGALFECRDLGRVEMKGLAEPVQAWQVLRASAIESRFEALHSSALTPLVGREEELDLLLRRWRRATSGEGQVVLLSGEPGIGKSRIVVALQERLQGEPHLNLRHFCSPYGVASTLYPVIARVERAAGFERGDGPGAKREKLQAFLASTATSGQDAALLMDLLTIGGDDASLDLSPHRKKQNTLEALLRQLEALARQQPLLVIFEDLHWIDPTSRELIDHMVDRVQRLPVLLLLTYRPEFEAAWSGRPHVTTVALSRLARREAALLVEKVTGAKPLPPEIVAQLVARTDGVPLFAEELTKTVIEGNIVRDAGDCYLLDGPLPARAIPATLHASLLARLDRLAPVREVAQIGAAIGREFSYELLAAVVPLEEAPLQEALARLTASGLVFGRGTPPAAVYAFKHALVQDAAYETLLKSRRRELHARIARALENDFAETAETQPELLAHHYAQAGLVAQAITHRHKAGRQALSRSAMIEATTHLTHALELLADVPPGAERDQQELELRVALGGALIAVRGFAAPEVGRTYERARELCGKGIESPRLLPVLTGLFQYQQHTSGPTASREIAQEVLRLAERHGDTAAMAAGHRALGASSLFCGDLTSAVHHLDRSLALYSPADGVSPVFQSLPELRAAARSFLALVLLWQGHADRALACGKAALADAYDLNHTFTLSQALYLNCWLHQVRGEAHIVRERASAMLPLTVEHNYPNWLAAAKILHGWAVAATGDAEAGLAQVHDGVGDKRALGVKLHFPCVLGLLAELLTKVGTWGEGLAVLDEALAIVGTTGERWFEPELHRLKAEALIASTPGDLTGAEASLDRALVVAREQGARFWELRAATTLARLWRGQGRRREAGDLLAPVYGWFTEGFDTPTLQAAKDLLDELGLTTPETERFENRP
jgi:class 3 adenylate cyclase/predicted ATPase